MKLFLDALKWSVLTWCDRFFGCSYRIFYLVNGLKTLLKNTMNHITYEYILKMILLRISFYKSLYLAQILSCIYIYIGQYKLKVHGIK